ncbi:uncharacterized protein VTP21DRAFT_990 [Calcarisporiella thermophila]|uniref:uncharacterized protein n=1 Tax=Calcarisporiella thermophila TaxID=911321 RepID=UPI00374207B0
MLKNLLFVAVTLTALASSFAAPATEKPLTTFFVASDTHRDYDDLARALQDMSALDPKYQALVINGDLTDSGSEQEYAATIATINKNPHPDRIFYNIGNHELCSDGTEEEKFARYKRLTKEPKIYYERNVDGFPFLFLGTETFKNKCYGVWFSPEQLAWLKERLRSHGDTGKPIFVYSHFPIHGTTSGSQGYETTYAQGKELLDLLGQYPQVILFTGHTHYKLYLDDWQARKVVEGGNPKGFQLINTGFIQTEWARDAKGNEYVPRNGWLENQSLYVQVYRDRVVVTGRDHFQKKWIQKLEIPYRVQP